MSNYTYQWSQFTSIGTDGISLSDLNTKTLALTFTSSTFITIMQLDTAFIFEFTSSLNTADVSTLNSFVANYNYIAETDLMCNITETYSKGTNAGIFPANSWVQRNINTISGQVDFITLSNNIITMVIPGIYLIIVTAPSVGAGGTLLRLSINNGSEYYYGVNQYSADNNSYSLSQLKQYLKYVAANTTMTIEHYATQSSGLTTGFGAAINIDVYERYCQVFIFQVDSF